jgi:hypothetical protein
VRVVAFPAHLPLCYLLNVFINSTTEPVPYVKAFEVLKSDSVCVWGECYAARYGNR